MQIVQTMQIPLAYAEDIIGIRGTNIEYIRGSTGAILTVHESTPEEITVEIKGTSSQVQAAQQLIQVDTFIISFFGGYLCILCSFYSRCSLYTDVVASSFLLKRFIEDLGAYLFLI